MRTEETEMVRHSHQDALDDASYDRLVEATDKLSDPFDAECLALLVLAGRLGMRGGEISHCHRDWLDTERKVIEIPHYWPCDDGQNGEICGYCHKRAAEAAEHGDVTVDEALEQRWEPKTPHSARAIPYDFDPFVEATVEEFFAKYERWPTSRVGVNRRVDRIADAADYDGRVYPHALRATAASFHAYRGVPPAALQSLFGWSNLAVAEKYVRLTGEATSRALKDAHSG